jgi:hypothetical protein
MVASDKLSLSDAMKRDMTDGQPGASEEGEAP